MSIIPKVTVPPDRRGPWRIERFTVIGNDLRSVRLMMQGRDCPPGDYTRLVHEDRGIVMSDTPAEMRDHAEFVRAAKGHCLINGLGLGMGLAAVMAKETVTHATVIEIDRDLIDLVWPHYEAIFGDRISVIHADALEWRPPKGVRYGAVWHDIWDEICLDNDPDMQKLHRRYGRRTDWQGSWGRPYINQMKRGDRSAYAW
ncbi:MAG: hypothetical protein LC676_10880 [Loktanella sp.]|nr:hypothetical protein [Loktanella sp.]